MDPMPRRTRAVPESLGDPDALRRHLIATTQRLLADQAPTSLTTRAIARAADVSDGVLYNHFGDKDDLVVVALVDLVGAQIGEFIAAVPTTGDADLRTNLDQAARACLTLQQRLIPVVAGLLSSPALLHRFFERLHDSDTTGPQEVIRAVSGLVEAEQSRGRADAGTPAHPVAALLFGATMLEALAGHVGRGDEAEFGYVVDFLARGLAPSATPGP